MTTRLTGLLTMILLVLGQPIAALSATDIQPLQLTEMWRVGGADDEENFFGQVIRIRSDDAGRLYVLDGQLQQVFVYDQQGELLTTLFGEGEGPGEVRRVRDLVFLSNGLIGAVCQFPGAMVTVDLDGNPGRSLRLSEPGRGFMAAAQRAGTLLVAETRNLPMENGTFTLRSSLDAIDSEGNITASFVSAERHVDYQNNYTFDEREAMPDFMFAFDIGPDGRVYTMSDPDKYAISVFQPDGTLERTIEREFASRKRSSVEKQRVEALIERRFRTFPFDLKKVVAETAAVSPWFLRGLQVANNGQVWVRHSRSDEMGRSVDAMTVLDVFDQAGQLERQVSVPVSGNAATTGVFLAGDDRLIVVHGFVDAMCSVFGGGAGGMNDGNTEPDPIEIVCYRITNR